MAKKKPTPKKPTPKKKTIAAKRPKPSVPPAVPSGAKESPKPGQQVKFVFNYRECHAPEVPPGGWTDEAFLEQLKERDWEQQGSAEDDLADSCEPEITSIADLLHRARQYFVAEEEQPDDVVQIPFEKLAALMARGRWSFVGGDFMEFEGNHNDSEIIVILEKASKS
jgi:hypothetical protein